MTKTPHDELAEEVRKEMTNYLRKGKLNQAELSGDLDFSDLEIEDFERLKRVHFVLYGSDDGTDDDEVNVINYVRKLPDLLRNISRESTRDQVVGRRIEGRIDWERTTKLRYSENYCDRSVFSYRTPQLEYDIPENLVLKKLLWVIYRTVNEDIVEQLREEDYSWMGWDEDLVKEIKDVFERNVHIDRIQEASDIQISSREMEAARESRKELYRETYKLYRIYDKLRRNEIEGKAEEVLLETLITPQRVYTLFELFAVFKIIKHLERRLESEMVLKRVGPEKNEIASIENEDSEIRVYHDQTGCLDFGSAGWEDIEDDKLPEGFFKKQKEVFEEHKDAANEFIGRNIEDSLFGGRPDMIIEKRIKENEENDKLEFLIIGEVKYTENEQTFSRGLRELLEYMKYAKDEDYVEEEVNPLGILITDGSETDESHICLSDLEGVSGDSDGEVIHFNKDDLKNAESFWEIMERSDALPDDLRRNKTNS